MAKKPKKIGANGDKGRDDYYDLALSLSPELSDSFKDQSERLSALAVRDGRHDVPAALAEIRRERAYGIPDPYVALLEACAAEAAVVAGDVDEAKIRVEAASEELEKFLNSKEVTRERVEGAQAFIRLGVAKARLGEDPADAFSSARDLADAHYSQNSFLLSMARALFELERDEEAFDFLSQENLFILDKDKPSVDFMLQGAIIRGDVELIRRLHEVLGSAFDERIATRQWNGGVGYSESPLDLAVSSGEEALVSSLLEFVSEEMLPFETERLLDRCVVFDQLEIARAALDVWIERVAHPAQAGWAARLGDEERAIELIDHPDWTLAVVYFALGKLDESQTTFESLEDIQKRRALCVMAQFATAETKRCFVDDALDAFLKDTPQSDILYRAKGLLAACKGDEDQAAEAFDAVRELAKDLSGYDKRALLAKLIFDEVRAGYPERAFATAIKIEKRHRNLRIFQPIATFYLQAGDPAGALICIDHIEGCLGRMRALIEALTMAVET